MPIYEYICADCGNAFEALVRNSESKPSCPKCESRNLKRRLSTFSPSVPSSSGRCPAAESCPSASSSCGCGGCCGHRH